MTAGTQSSDTAQLLRLYYLQQLGITSWVPRVSLPGALAQEEELLDTSEPYMPPPEDMQQVAAVSELLRDSEPPFAVHEEDEPFIETPVRKPVLESQPREPAPAPLVRKPVPETVARKPVQQPASAVPDDEVLVAPFQMLFAVVSPELAVALQIPSAMKLALRDSETRLLVNLLRWLGLAWPATTQLFPFQWPLPGLPATGAVKAGHGLQAFLHQAQMEQSFQRLLVLGKDPAQALLAAAGQPSLPQVWHTHSLAELLALPALKYETWQTLLPLRAQLLS